MSTSLTYAEGYEVLGGGEPTFPPTIEMPLYDRDYPLMHGGSIVVASDEKCGGVVLAIAHPGFVAGFFMGMTPAEARATAAWLLSAADDIDGGSGKQ